MVGAFKSLLGIKKKAKPSQVAANLRNFDIAAGGFRGRTHISGPTVESSLTTSPGVQAFRSRGTRSLSDLDVLRKAVAPGFSQIRFARREAIQSARQRTISNLRENFGRRRLSGSAFAAREIASAEAEFAKEQAASEAQAFLEEQRATQAILQQEAQITTARVAQDLTELGIARDLALKSAGIISSNVAALNQIKLAEAVSSNQIDAQLAGDIIGAVGFGVGSALSAPSKPPSTSFTAPASSTGFSGTGSMIG